MSCACEHTINRDGSGQLDRYLKALDPNYAPIDSRDIKDLLVYAKKYAGQIRFYDLPEQTISDGIPEEKLSWRGFFEKDVAVIAASIGLVDLEQIKKDYDETRSNLEHSPGPNLLTALYNPLIGIATRLENWLSVTIPANPLHQDILLAINSSLSGHIQKAKAIEGGYVAVDAGTELNVDYSSLKNPAIWGLDDSIDPDLAVYEGTDEDSKIRNAALYLDDTFLAFYGYLSELVDRSVGYLNDALEQFPFHQPHMALFITFLKLFSIVRDQMNGITERMLNFYYREVLQLVEKPSIPDKVHIVFELAKGVAEYQIKKATELDGGKDIINQDQVYLTENEIVLNQAKVAELKTLYIEKVASEDGKSGIREIYARPVANSLDGFGKPFESEYPTWDTFGRGRRRNALPVNICDEVAKIKDEFLYANEAAIGFALASPQLVLQGGNRLIMYRMTHLGSLLNNEYTDKGALQIKLTTDNGWLSINTVIAPALASKLGSVLQSGHFGGAELQIDTGYFISEDLLIIYLPPGEAPIVGYDSEIHQSSFTTSFPVMQILFGPQLNIDESAFRSLNFSSAALNVKVGSINSDVEARHPNMDGLTKLTLQNNAGPLDPDNIFDPFTAYPNMGKSLYIGGDEIFNKPLTALSINVQLAMETLPETPEPELFSTTSAIAMISNATAVTKQPFKANLRAKRQWRPLSKANSVDFNAGDLTQNMLVQNGAHFTVERTPLTSYDSYSGNTIKGFVEIQWSIPITGKGELSSFQRMQELAEVLKVKAISVSYEAQLDHLDTTIDQFYHVYPFGTVEVLIPPKEPGSNEEHIRLKPNPVERLKQFSKFDAAKDYLLVDADGRLLPHFTYADPYGGLVTKPAIKGMGRHSVATRMTGLKSSMMEQLVYNASGLNTTLGVNINQYKGREQEEGLLYIGLENLKPQQMLTLLFQFAEGSAQDEDNDPPEIHWSYLSNNEWKPLPDVNIVSDDTYGFQTTGIVKIDVPSDATNNNTIVTSGLHWFRTSVTENSHRIPKLVDVVAQAVVAKFDDRGNDPSHFECPLPAGTIGKLVTGKAEVNSVEQPFASWNGKARERGKEFFVRVSERLRHKGRAINAWDYEHLVLDRFPSIYKVKALTHTDPNCLCRENVLETGISRTTIKYNENGGFEADEIAKVEVLLTRPTDLLVEITAIDTIGNVALAEHAANQIRHHFLSKGFAADNITVTVINEGVPFSIEIALLGDVKTETYCCGPQIAPGHVMIVPISNFKSRNAIDPLQPKTSRRTLLEIEEYLKKRTSPFVRIHAKNPVYEQILVFFLVRFHPGVDKGYHLKLLNDEIVQYLTPWAFNASADVKFSQKVYASSIINFIEERPYVDFIKNFFMGVCKRECCPESHEILPRPPLEVVEELKEDFFDVLDPNNPDTTIIKGRILDARNDEPIAGANLSDTASSMGTQTDMSGGFDFDLQATNLEIMVAMVGFETKTLTVTSNTNWTIYLFPAEIDEVVVTGSRREDEDETLGEMFSRFCGCADVEKELSNSEFIGETVIAPSTNRSLLVSAPKHFIIPCVEEEEPSPCDKRKLQRLHGRLKDFNGRPSVERQSDIPQPETKSATKSESKSPAKTSKEKPGSNKAREASDKLGMKTVKELKKMAKAKGISGYYSMRKAELIAALSK